MKILVLRRFTAGLALALASVFLLTPLSAKAAKTPVIDVTDLYHPCQDIGDNFDLVTAYALPEIDLRAVILDCTDEWRSGSRLDPGFIPVTQLNYLFNRNVPCATIPWQRMKTLDDTMLDAPAFQQAGIELILRVLRESKEPVHVLSFGSARAIAVAFNRDPALCREKIKLIYLSAGNSNYDQDFEHNVKLDRLAIVRLLRSDLPIAVYPCGADNADSIGYGVKLAPFSYCPNNSYWKMPNSDFINQMDPRLCRYLVYAFQRESRADFLRAMDEKKTGDFKGVHYVWETGVWIQVSGRRLVQHADGTCRIIPADRVVVSDRVVPNDLRPCTVEARDDGMFYWQPAEHAATKKWIYYRGDAVENEKALQDALPALYKGFHPDARMEK